MTKIAMLATAAIIAFASPAAAGWQNGVDLNGMNTNGLTSNGLTSNGLTGNAVIAHSPPSDFCAQGNGDMVAHSPPSDFCAQDVARPTSLGFGGLDGMKVMSIELPR